MVGGAILGYCSIGRDIRPRTPNITINIEMTVESTGLLIKVDNFMMYYLDISFHFLGEICIPSFTDMPTPSTTILSPGLSPEVTI